MTDQQPTPRVTVAAWPTVRDSQGRPAFTAGQVRAALAGLADNEPVAVTVAAEDDDVAGEQIITDAGYGNIDWSEGKGQDTEQSPLFLLNCSWADKPLLNGLSYDDPR